MSNMLEVYDLQDGGKEAKVKLYDDKDLSNDEQKLIEHAIHLLVDGGKNQGIRLAASDSRALVVRAAISQWIKATKKIAEECGG